MTANARPRPKLVDAVIVLFLLFQVGMTLPFYLGWRGQDERFSWRMFSSLMARDCHFRVIEQAKGERRELDTMPLLPSRWLDSLERARPAVIEEFLAWDCERSGADEIHYLRFCSESDGSPVQPIRYVRDCSSASVLREGDRP